MCYVFFEDRIICFSDRVDGCGPDAVVVNFPAGGIDFAKVLENLENNKDVVIKSANPKLSFENFAAGFVKVEAAGGLVGNGRGEYLMIFRKGWWDLPKGHIDEGETPEQCALREVREECGNEDLRLTEKITETFHIYIYEGRWRIKRTHWFLMRSDQRELYPEAGEGIEAAVWVKAADMERKLKDSYSTIREVFERATAGTGNEI